MSYRVYLPEHNLLTGMAAGLTVKGLAIHLKCAPAKVKASLRHHRLKMPRRTDLKPGAEYGKLTIHKKLPSPSTTYSLYECLCACGQTVVLRRANLTSGNSRSCGCTHHRRGNDHPRFTGHEKIGGNYWRTLRKITKKAGRPFSITIEDAWALFLAQDGRCALSGLPIFFAVSKRHDTQTASLDRIDSRLGYVPGNVQWVHKHINIMKRDHDQAYFIALCERVAARNHFIGLL